MRRLALVSILALVAVSAAAQRSGMAPLIAPDGTVIVVRPAIAANNQATTELIAVSPSGTTLWKWDAGAMMHTIAAGPGRLFVAAHGPASNVPPMMGGGTAAVTGEVVALSLAGGAVQWRREVPAPITAIEAAADRVYVVTGMAGPMISRMPWSGRMTRPAAGEPALIALDAATGTVLWTVPLQ